MNARGEILRITASLTAACALGAAVLGGIYMATDRYQKVAQARSERAAIADLLALGARDSVQAVDLYLVPASDEVVYRSHAFGDEDLGVRELTFSLDGRLVAGAAGAGEPATPRGTRPPGKRVPLGKIYVARRGGALAGFVVEGTTRGYKNRIRFLVGLTPGFEIAGVRVVEHEEDPGLGAEVATPAFGGQYIARPAGAIAALDVTRDPMPEDWRAALAQLSRTPAGPWRERHAALVAREGARPIYAVTGATISSRALTDGVRVAVEHFRRRWALIEPHLGAAS